MRAVLLRTLQDPTSLASLSPAELDFALRVLRRARLLGRVALQVQEAGLLDALPLEAADQLLSAIVLADWRARSARWELDRLAWALSDLREVPIVALKGCAYLLAGTPNALGRLFADVDLLVPEQHLASVEAALRSRGWTATELTPYDERYYRVWAHELPPLKNVEREAELDLHHSILMRTARLKPSSALLFEAMRDVLGSRFKVLAPTDMVLHAITHLFYGGEMDDALRELVDIADLLHHFGETEAGFWEGFWARAEALDLARPAFYGLRYARELLGVPVPEVVVVASEAAAPPASVRALMDRLVPQGLFPQHPDAASPGVDRARLALYVRSHWVKMPALLLTRHLVRKAAARYQGRRQSGPV